MPERGKVVWSSETEGVHRPKPAQTASAGGAAPAGKQVARLIRDRKGRGGKVVTVIEGLRLSAVERDALARDLRRACGAGGTVKGDLIEVQGDLRERLAELLLERGYQVKMVGG